MRSVLPGDMSAGDASIPCDSPRDPLSRFVLQLAIRHSRTTIQVMCLTRSETRLTFAISQAYM
jgi:hypothetical protein